MVEKRSEKEGDGTATGGAGGDGTAILLLDVVNDFEFEDGERLLEAARPAAEAVGLLRERARAAGVPVVYANDNYGRWRDSLGDIVEHCLRSRGAEIVERLLPGDDDYFVLKPRHSAFYQTSLETLLERLGARRLVLAGFTADICVLFTAIDAYMRHYRVVIAADACASVREEHRERALEYAARVLDASIPSAARVELGGAGRGQGAPPAADGGRRRSRPGGPAGRG